MAVEGLSKKVPALLTAASLIGFLWGYAEGTIFFVIPDVVISFVALYSLPGFLVCSAATLLGSVLGGISVYLAALYFPALTNSVIHAVPFIPQKLFDVVTTDFRQQGVWALLDGPTSGIPYKVYACQAPDFTGLGTFILVSIPVRLCRFLVIGFLTFFTASIIKRRGSFADRKLLIPYSVVWTLFYIFYWFHMSRI
ncbi:MAG: hypothetical protein PW788_11570 [Micavibrio sp.]|nr:hypothetical protein [Micavibrio sp.]